MPDYASDYTIDEQILVCIAREIRDGELVQQGGGTALGIASVMLARLTHAPNLKYNYLTSTDPLVYSLAGEENTPAAVSATSLKPFAIDDMVSMCLRGKTNVFTTMPAQIDKYGNVNASLIGDHQHPRVRFPGGLGISDWLLYAGRVNVYVPRHTARVFVEKVDYVTGYGRLPGGHAARREAGIPGEGPVRVFSNLAVMGFDDASGLMQLESLHAGVALDEVQANTGFELGIPDEIPATEPPTAEQLDLIRNKIDPNGLRKARF